MSVPVEIPCGHCHALNRVPAGKLDDDPHCGRCKSLLLEGHPLDLTMADFDAVAARGDLPVVVDFWAPWCGPCLRFAPVYAEAAPRWKSRARLAKVDTEAQPQLAHRFGIRSIPTLVVLRRGREVARQPGALGATQLQQFLEGAVARH